MHMLSKWESMLIECHEKSIPVYVWSGTSSIPASQKKYDWIHYITNDNKTIYNSDIIKLEKKLDDFANTIGMIHMRDLAQHHMKSFFLTKEDFIVNIDGDDMFYPWMKLKHIEDLIDGMINNNYDILTKPHWILLNMGWSFGFTVYRRTMMNDIFFDYEINNNLRQFFIENNLDKNKVFNLDNWFGAIFYTNPKYKDRKKYFAFEDNPYWDYSVYTTVYERTCVTSKLIKNFVIDDNVVIVMNKENKNKQLLLVEDNIDYMGADIIDYDVTDFNIDMIKELVKFHNGIGFTYVKNENKIFIKHGKSNKTNSSNCISGFYISNYI
jgi:hypothetical protein